MKITVALALGLGATLALVACGDEPNNNNTTSGTAGSGGGTGGSGGGSGGGGGSAGALEVQSHLSPDGFVVNSHLIIGDTEAVLVDGQFFSAEAQKVVDMITASGKTLTTVFLTHGHPDHYLGMEVIRTAFPDAKFVTTAKVLVDYDAKKDATLAAMQMNFPGQVPDKVVAFTALTGNTIMVDGHSLDVIELPMAGESEVSAGLAIKDAKAFVAGDLIYNKAHLWLAECKLDGWTQNLDFIAAMNFETYYPGHGVKATATVVDEDKQYLVDVPPILTAATMPDAAVAEVKMKYPDWTGDGLLQFSTQMYFGACK
jgi:glyoxylase-like metal-dependent hydrolase (beta-lactamase superfamily II)